MPPSQPVPPTHADHPGVIGLPPLLFGATLAAGLVAGAIQKRPTGLPRAVRWAASGLLFALAGPLAVNARNQFVRAGTNVAPTLPALAIVTTGPYRWTRNPMYTAVAMAYLAVAVAADSPPALALLPALLTLIQKGVVEREERYLEGKFGETYLLYKRSVPRWL